MASNYVICIRNDGYRASLEVRKLYQRLADPEADRYDMVRVVDESGDDYLYPSSHFVAVDLPAETERTLEEAS